MNTNTNASSSGGSSAPAPAPVPEYRIMRKQQTLQLMDIFSCTDMPSEPSACLQDRCNNSEHWAKNRYCEKRCFEAGRGYGNDCSTDGDYREDHVCGYEEELVPFAQAEKNCEEIGMKICDRTRVRVFSERVE